MRRRLVLTLIVCVLALLAVWQRDSIQSWLQARLVQQYVDKIAPHLPFKIEKAEVRQTWKEVLSGKISNLSLVLNWEGIRFHLSGPIEIRRREEVSIRYLPEMKIEPRSTPIPLLLQVRISKNLTRLLGLELEIQTDRWDWPAKGVHSEKPEVHLSWADEQATLSLSVRSINYSLPGTHDHAVQVEGLDVHARSDLKKQVHFDWKGKSAEVLWADFYADLALELLPGSGQFDLEQNQLRLSLPKLEIALRTGPLIEVDWKTGKLPLKEISTAAASSFSAWELLKEIQIRHGTLQSRGKARINLQKPFESEVEGYLSLQELAFLWPKKAFAGTGVNFEGSLSNFRSSTGRFAIDRWYFRRLQGRLQPTSFSVRPTSRKRYGLRLGESTIPLQIDGIPLKIGAVTGFAATDDHELTTSLILEPTNLGKVLDRLCLKPGRVPPSSFSLNFPKIEITPGTIDPTGNARLDLMNGHVVVDEVGVFDVFTEVPEIDFNLGIDGVRLDLLGAWLGLGEVDGLLQGYAKDVVFQSWLPTQYDARFELKPFSRKKIIFSPEAMKNFIRLFAGDDIDNLPGFADWIAFGPIKRYFGGYDLYYGGVSLFSSDGMILIETVEPPGEVGKDGQHFLLHGKNINMPLPGSRYPLVVDSTSMANFLRRFINRLGALKSAQGKPSEENTDELDESCIPDFD